MSLLNDLDQYYRREGIHAEDFRCRCFSENRSSQSGCKEPCQNSPCFTKAKSSFVGSEYETCRPRLLFLSLDPGSGEVDEKKRTPEGVRDCEEKRHVESLPRNQHWYITHELASAILNKCRDGVGLKACTATKYFAHVNSAKCCENNPANKQAKDILFENCRRYLKEELRILAPDIVVTQGDKAHESFGLTFAPGQWEKWKPKDLLEHQVTVTWQTIRQNNVLWLLAYHPSHPSFYLRWRGEFLSHFADHAQKFCAEAK
jgi:uracil-DNA glycosylase